MQTGNNSEPKEKNKNPLAQQTITLIVNHLLAGRLAPIEPPDSPEEWSDTSDDESEDNHPSQSSNPPSPRP